MRRLGVVLCATLLLAGCASTPTGDEVGPIGLVDMWRVTAEGESADTWVKFDATGLTSWSDCGILMGGWRAAGTSLVTSPFGSIGSPCADYEHGLPDWLYEASGFERIDDDNYRLLSSGGDVLARLTIDGLPPTSRTYMNTVRERPRVTDDTAALFAAPAALPAEATPIDELEGRWIPSDAAPGRSPFVEFIDNGWEGSDGCNGVGGRWLSGPGGLFLATWGPQSAIGCDNSRVAEWLSSATRIGMVDDHLALYDRSGAELGYLVRG